MTADLSQGWGFPLNSRKAHYFDAGESTSLCGKWMYTGPREHDPLDFVPSPDDCVACPLRPPLGLVSACPGPPTRMETRMAVTPYYDDGTMTGDPLCGNCGHETPTLAPCPCALGPECPITGGGVCPNCYRTTHANAIQRRKEHAA